MFLLGHYQTGLMYNYFTDCFTQEVADMKTTMIVALAATAMLLMNPLPGFARGSQSQGPNARGPATAGSYQQGGSRYGGHRGSYSHGGYRGAYSHGGYRGTYSHGGYRYGGYPYGGYHYWGHPNRSNVYFSGGIWVDPLWGPWWWGPAWPTYYPYYSTPPVVIQQSPTEYIQRNQEAEGADYWYYCRTPEGFYPYVQRCPNGWMKVAPSSVPPDQ
jgi:hypothetical protein